MAQQLRKLASGSTVGEVLSGWDLTGKTAVLTGLNSGLGLEMVKALSSVGARVLFTSRSGEKGDKVIADLRSKGIKGALACEEMDLTDLASVRNFANRAIEEPNIDCLLLNAGVAFTPKKYTKYGWELQIASNHFGHFYLTQLLTDKLRAQDFSSRIVATSSVAHNGASLDVDDLHFRNRPYGRFASYGQSKLANILFIRELARRHAGSNLSAFAVHPGTIATNVFRHLGAIGGPLSMVARVLGNSEQTATASLAYACVTPGLEAHSGAYLADCKIVPADAAASDAELAKRLWETTEQQIQAALQQHDWENHGQGVKTAVA